MGITRATVFGVYRLLQVQGEAGGVSIDTFVNALVYYHNQGTASYTDVATLIAECSKERKRWSAFTSYTQAQFASIHRHLGVKEDINGSQTTALRNKSSRNEGQT